VTQQSPDESGAPARPGADARLRWALVALLAVVAVGSAVALVLEVTVLRPRSAEAAADEQNRSDVVRTAERFAVQTNTYDSRSLGDYQKRVTGMLSPTFKDEYTKVIDQLLASIRQAKVTSKGQVLTSAVAGLDPDSAQVLVVADANVRTIFNSGLARHFRWEVSLVKIHGRWLVDDFSPVA
jgi:Mce-associated membrane protein